MGNAFLHPVPPKPRFKLGKIRVGAVACLCLWAAAGVSGAPALDSAGAATTYRQAMDSFNREEYSRALDLLGQIPDTGKPGEQADVSNLRGAVYLHQRQYDKARAAFARAIEKDPGLWAARFNLAEVNFRQGKYAESSKQFEELLGHTSRWTRSDERGFLQYKLLLTQMLAGREKPAQTYVDEHRGDRVAPLMYFYLNAALEKRRGHDRQAEQWLAQGDAHYSPANEQVFAESFRSLGWYTQRSERLIAAARRHDASATTPTSLAVVELIPGQTPAARSGDVPAKTSAALALPPAATPGPKPAFRTTAPTAPPGEIDFAAQMPPSADGGDLPDNAPIVDSAAPQDNPDPRAVYSHPVVLGRPTNAGGKPKGTPGASASPSASAMPSASAATATPASSPATAAAPKPEFLEKYEQAYVKFLEKNFADARRLLDEADAIQSGQNSSSSLRSQIFKHYYEVAYLTYKKGDYNDALVQLNEADTTQSNQPDALNLRGLTYSKQKVYDKAEDAFRRAIQADPEFWAARFNYAELPFNYRNYTAARTRYEELSARTDASRQPKESELTQFKIFLTLLLEGKVDGARSFMNHLSFTGTTPARYFCQAALEFYAGNSDKAQAEITTANKEFQPRLVDIFKESFYRIGWLVDPSNPTATGPTVADTAPAATPEASPATVVMATPTPAPSLAVTVVTPTPAPSLAAVTPTPVPSGAATTPAPTLAVAAATPLPTAAMAPAATAGPAVAQTSTPEPEETPTARPAKLSKNENTLRLLLIGSVFITFIVNCIRFLIALMNHKPRRPLAVKRSPLYEDNPEAEQPDEVEVPR